MQRLTNLLLFLLPLLGFAQKPELIVPIGHSARNISAVFSPDGQYILTSSQGDEMVILWDLHGNELQSFSIGKGMIRSAYFSPDGQHIFAKTFPEYEEGKMFIPTTKAWKLNGQVLPYFKKATENVVCTEFTPDGQLMFAGSSDGVIKTWTLDGREINSFKAHQGKVFAITISKNGQYIITEGWDIYSNSRNKILWDLHSQKKIKDLSGFSSLVFGPNDQYMIEKGLGTKDTFSLLSIKGEMVKVFEDFAGANFSPDGRFVVLEKRSEPLSLWSLETHELRDLGEKDLFDFSSDGRFLLLGKQYGQEVELLDLAVDTSQVFDGFDKEIEQLALSPDGSSFIVSDKEGDTTTLRMFDIPSRKIKASFSFKGYNSFIEFSPDSQSLVVDANRNELISLNMDLKRIGMHKGYAKNMSHIFFSKDGSSIINEAEDKSWNLQFNAYRASDEEKPVYAGMDGDILRSPDGSYIFGADEDGTSPGLYPQSDEAAKAIEGKGGIFEGHTGGILSAAFSADGQLILTGSDDNTARLWNLYGKNLQTFTGHSGSIRSVGFSSDNQLILTGSKKMAKLWRPNSPDELISLIQIDSADWVVTTPSGLFDATPGAMNLMHYCLFYEPDQEYITIEIEQLKARYYEPGLLQKVLGYSDDRIRPVDEFNEVKLYPKVNTSILADTLQVKLKERNGGIGKVSIFINGKEVVQDANPLPRRENAQRDSLLKIDLNQYRNYLFRHPDSTNFISIRAYNEEGWLKSPEYKLEYQIPSARSRGSGGSGGGSAWVGQLDPKLYVVSIGTSNYTGTKLDLQYADQDATMMAKALQSVGTALFTNGDSLEVHCFSTANADSTGLENTAIRWQFAEKDKIESVFRDIKNKAKAEDVIVVYMSGHGVAYGSTEQVQFHYLTQGIASEDLSDAAIRQAYTISSEELTKWINDIPALKQVLIIDACNSGQIVENLTGGTKSLNSSQIRALDRMKDRTGMFILSGSASDKVSYEASEYGQGLLTYALLQGMLGVATRKDAKGRETIDVMKLFQHARDQVPELAKSINGIQTPMLGFPSQGASFDIGILDEKAKANIPIGNKKPVIIRSLFQDEDSFGDELDLVGKIEAAFREESEEGKDADFIFVDVNQYPNAYSLKGLYRQIDAEIQVKARIFQNGQPITDLNIPETDNADNMVRRLIRALKKYLRDISND